MRGSGLLALLLLVSQGAGAAGVHTNVALPVAQGEVIFRSQLRYLRATGDPTPADREVDVLLAPQTLALGITPRLTAFATLPVLLHRRVDASTGSRRTAAAFGDARLTARYTVWRDDYGPLATRRVALLAGAKTPTGARRFGSPTWDPRLGAVGTWASGRHQFDLDALYTFSTERRGFRAGQALRADAAYGYRLWPARFGPRLVQLTGLIEVTGEWSERDRSHRRRVSASGGRTLSVAPGLQLVTQRWILEGSVQVPVHQQLRGAAVERDVVAVLGVRVPFSIPWP